MEVHINLEITNTAPTPSPSVKIPLDYKRFSKLYNGYSSLERLVDGDIETKADPDFGVFSSPSIITYDFSGLKNVVINELRFYDVEGTLSSPLFIYAIDEYNQRVLLATYTGDLYMEWKEFDFAPVKAKYIWIVSEANLASDIAVRASEFEVWGSYEVDDRYPIELPSPNVLFDNLVGSCIYEWNVLDPSDPTTVQDSGIELAVAKLKVVRHYCDWVRLEGEKDMLRFAPEWSGGWNLDVMYQWLHDNDIKVITCFQGVPTYISESYPVDPGQDVVPVEYPNRFDDPKSYIQQAKLAFNFAARYGSNTSVPTELLNIDTRQPDAPWELPNEVKVGLNLVSALECGNEVNKFWKSRENYQNPREHAANLSAFYDGHKGALGPGVGVKQADPNMLVCTMGAISVSYEYFRSVIDWCKQYRGYREDGTVDVPFDIIQYHRYNNDEGGGQHGSATTGKSPEESNMYEDVVRLKELVAEFCPEVLIMCGENGYDWNQGSIQKAPPIGSKTALQVIGDWELRTALEMARARVDINTFYQLLDDDPTGESTIQYATCGIINNNYSNRPAIAYMVQALNILSGFRYNENISLTPRVDKWIKDDEVVYAIWSPTESDTVDDYVLTPDTHLSAKLYTMNGTSDTPTETPLEYSASSYIIEYSETPVFVKLTQDGPPPVGRIFNVGTGSGNLTINGTNTGAAWYPLEPGDTFIIKGGTYGSITTSNLESTGAPIVIKNEADQQVTADFLYINATQKNVNYIFDETLERGLTLIMESQDTMHIDRNGVGGLEDVYISGIKFTIESGTPDGGVFLRHSQNATTPYSNGSGVTSIKNLTIENIEFDFTPKANFAPWYLMAFNRGDLSTSVDNNFIDGITIRNIRATGTFYCSTTIEIKNCQNVLVDNIYFDSLNNGWTDSPPHARIILVQGQGIIQNCYMRDGMGNVGVIWGYNRLANNDPSIIRNCLSFNTFRYSTAEIQGYSNLIVSGISKAPHYKMLGLVADTLDTGNYFSGCAGDIYPLQGGTFEARNSVSINGHSNTSGQNNPFNNMAGGTGTLSNNAVYANRTLAGVEDETYIPQSGSPLIGAGVANVDFTEDYNGNIRPNPPSIGALEPLT